MHVSFPADEHWAHIKHTHAPTHQLLAVGLGLLPASDLHVHLVAGVFQFDLQRPPLCLGLGENLLTGSQIQLRSLPAAPTVLEVLSHLDEVWDEKRGRLVNN